MNPINRIAAAVGALFLLAGCGPQAASGDSGSVVSDIKNDETVVFFRTSGWLESARNEWHVPVHGWIYEPQNSKVRLEVFENVLDKKFGLSVTEKTKANFARRTNLLLADNERSKTIVIDIAGRKVELPASAQNGHFKTTIVISATEADKFAADGFVHFAVVTPDTERRKFKGAVKLISPDGLSIISDIDDTVKISNVRDHKSLLEQTFLLDFVAAPGMAGRYRDWSSDNVSFHYVSSSPWQLYAPLRDFFDEVKFPWATFSLKAVRFRDETVFDLFKEGTITKPPAIEAILDRYPARQFLLVGDSGEQDPEVYAALLRQRPQQILRVYIRDVTQDKVDGERYANVFKGIDSARWSLFKDPAQLVLPVAN